VAIVFLVRLQRRPELRERTRAWIGAQLEKPLLRPVAPYLRAAWTRVVRPLAQRSEKPAQFVWNRFTPGELGLEITTLLSLAAVGIFTFALLGDAPEAMTQERFDDMAFDIADSLYSEPIKDVLVWVTALGSFPVVALLVAATALWAVSRRRYLDAAALIAGFLLTWIAVDVAKEAFDRQRPPGAHVLTEGMAYPSGHAANGVAWIACAVALVRGGAGIATRFAVVTAAVVLAAAIALTRVYLRAHYLADVNAGLALATAIFALAGLVAVTVGELRQNERAQE
jgi:membrane-associated phospholipid phosphatase